MGCEDKKMALDLFLQYTTVVCTPFPLFPSVVELHVALNYD